MEQRKNTLLECATFKIMTKNQTILSAQITLSGLQTQKSRIFPGPSQKKKHFSRNSRPGTKNRKMQGSAGFPGGVQTLERFLRLQITKHKEAEVPVRFKTKMKEKKLHITNKATTCSTS